MLRSTQLCIPPGQINLVLAYPAEVKVGRVHLCRVQLCDPIWQMMLRSSEVRSLIKSYTQNLIFIGVIIYDIAQDLLQLILVACFAM